MLSREQTPIAEHGKGHAKVIATAGSGKSTTIAARVVRLIEAGVNPNDILIVMFNRDARDSFKQKLAKLLGKNAPRVFTFHGLGSEIIRSLVDAGDLPNWRLETSDYRLFTLAKEIMEPWINKLGNLNKRTVVDDFMSFVDLAKGHCSDPLDVAKEYLLPPQHRFFLTAIKEFEAERTRRKIRFFSDLIFDPITYLLRQPDKAAGFANRYEHIIVDECQDINEIQQAMVKILAGTRASVMVVGDDDQCIYSWRGAKPDYLISGFDKAFPGAKTYLLTRTFRYGHVLSAAASHIIGHNRDRHPKLCVSGPGTPGTTVALDVERVGQPSVPRHLQAWTGSGRSLKEVAVLVRSFSQAIPIEISLLSEGIPYRIEGADPVFDSPDIGALVFGLHLAAGTFETLPEAQQARLATFFLQSPPLGLNPDAEKALSHKVRQDPQGTPTLLDDAQFSVPGGWVRERLYKRASAWRNIACMSGSTPEEIIDYVMEATGVEHHIQYVTKTEEQAEDLRRRYECFRTYAEHCKLDLRAFVEHIEQLRSATSALKSQSDSEAVVITSVHRSKGLEWPFVILPGLSQGRFPFVPRSGEFSIEDERRLFFVAMTRAQQRLVMICPPDRQLQQWLGIGASGSPDLDVSTAVGSQFLYESNLFLCQQIEKAMAGDPQVLGLGVKSPNVVNAYLAALGIKRGLSGSQAAVA